LRRVLHILDGFGAGGAETWLRDCVIYIKKNPHLNIQFDFLCTGGVPQVYDNEIIENGGHIFYVKFSLGRALEFRKELIRILHDGKYDAIHDHCDFVTGWHLVFMLPHLPKIRIAHLHNPFNYVNNYITGFQRYLSFKVGRILTYGLSTAITGTSDHVMDEYGYDLFPYKKIRISPAYCGFPCANFQFSAEARYKIRTEFNIGPFEKVGLFVGRIGLNNEDKSTNQKNPSFAFEVAQILVKNYHWKFIFVGRKATYGHFLEQEVEQLGLSGKIIFTDVRKDVPSFMSAADAFLFPSLWEGLGMVVVEAQASGLPVYFNETLPKEAIRIPQRVIPISLSSGPEFWASQINGKAPKFSNYNRKEAIPLVQQSGFSIENSFKQLLKTYQLL
jgi:glycosyltransferase EpsF